MPRQTAPLVALIAAALLLLGCQTVPVYDVIDAPVSTASGRASAPQVKSAIYRAGTSLGWRLEDLGSGRLLATLNQRDAMAQTEISYGRDRYSIIYRDSNNLKYDGSTIRGGYNRWIRNLDKRIRVELSGL